MLPLDKEGVVIHQFLVSLLLRVAKSEGDGIPPVPLPPAEASAGKHSLSQIKVDPVFENYMK